MLKLTKHVNIKHEKVKHMLNFPKIPALGIYAYIVRENINTSKPRPEKKIQEATISVLS